MLTFLRDALYRAMTTERGDSVAPIRLPKEVARRLNATFGRPLAPKDELARRATARARLAALRVSGGAAAKSSAPSAPILVYVEGDRNVRAAQRIEELLAAKGHAWKRLDVAGDEATIDFVTRHAKCERDELPVVFVGDRAVGGYEALVRADVSGDLARLVASQ